MKRLMPLLALTLALSGCETLPPVPSEQLKASKKAAERPHAQEKDAPRQQHLPDVVTETVLDNRSMLEAEDPALQPDRKIHPETSPTPRQPTTYPMRRVKAQSEAHRDLNAGEQSKDYLQSRQRGPDPFYDEVNRTGSNPMNTQDRTTNRRVR